MPTHTKILPTWAQPSCKNMRALSATYGAVTHVIGLDRLFVGLGAPPALHWALGGAAADYQCRGGPVFDQEYAMNMATGYAGGVVAAILTGR